MSEMIYYIFIIQWKGLYCQYSIKTLLLNAKWKSPTNLTKTSNSVQLVLKTKCIFDFILSFIKTPLDVMAEGPRTAGFTPPLPADNCGCVQNSLRYTIQIQYHID